MAGNRLNMFAGAVAGAALVAGLGALLGALLRDLAHPAIVIAFGVFGAIFGAYAAGVVAYDRRRARLAPTAGYREGAFAELEYEPAQFSEGDAEEKADPAEGGFVGLARRRAASLVGSR